MFLNATLPPEIAHECGGRADERRGRLASDVLPNDRAWLFLDRTALQNLEFKGMALFLATWAPTELVPSRNLESTTFLMALYLIDEVVTTTDRIVHIERPRSAIFHLFRFRNTLQTPAVGTKS